MNLFIVDIDYFLRIMYKRERVQGTDEVKEKEF
jgi:hypothetical protein